MAALLFVFVNPFANVTRADHPDECTDNADCDDGLFCNGEERCTIVGTSGDRHERRKCVPAREFACLSTRCDERLDRCVPRCPTTPDADGDGHVTEECGGDDCDDSDPNRFPGNPEVCDGEHRDEDCDPSTFGDRDLDGDGFADARCCNADADGLPVCGSDCDDFDVSIHPGATEACDQVDNDCNGDVDEGVAVPGFHDLDLDGYGDPGLPRNACPGTSGFSVLGNDCDDDNVAIQPGTMRCGEGPGDVQACGRDGVFHAATCLTGEICRGQPAGDGICDGFRGNTRPLCGDPFGDCPDGMECLCFSSGPGGGDPVPVCRCF